MPTTRNLDQFYIAEANRMREEAESYAIPSLRRRFLKVAKAYEMLAVAAGQPCSGAIH